MEADLARWYQIDYRDRWRRDENGKPRLTLRRLYVLLRHLPPDAALVRALGDGQAVWNLEHVILAHIWQAVARSKKPHPLLAKAHQLTKRLKSPERISQLEAARKRAEKRRARLKS